MFRAVLISVLMVGGLLANVAKAQSIEIQGSSYFRSGVSDVGLIASFGPSESSVWGVTKSEYSGLVEINVSGVGQSLGAYVNDAFYLTDLGFHDNLYYQLAADLAPITGSPGNPTNFLQLAKNLIVYDFATGQSTNPIYIPAKDPSSSYRFVIDLSLTASGLDFGKLYFGVSDGYYSDNAGQYSIDVYQLTTAPIPEPSTYALFAVGLCLLTLVSRRKKGGSDSLSA